MENFTQNKSLILIVDDQPENIDILYSLLKDRYEIKVASNGQKALDILSRGGVPDLILLDVVMPGLNGFEVCKRVKSSFSTKNIPIIFVTSKNEEIDEQKGFSMGAVDYITKPISPSIVQTRIKTHLTLYNQKRHLEELVRERTAEIYDTRLKIIRKLGKAGEFRDNETGMHVIRMSKICALLGKSIGMSEDESQLLLNVAPMHDIGKIGIPDNVLLKPGKFNDSEWNIMKTHTTIGYQIIGDDRTDLLREAAVCALTHHEKWDGSGYPQGLKGEDIPLYGRITAIGDVFDALTSDRSYKKAWSIEDAISLIQKERGRQFEPRLVDAFLEITDEVKIIKEEYKD